MMTQIGIFHLIQWICVYGRINTCTQGVEEQQNREFVIRNSKIERVRERERIYLNPHFSAKKFVHGDKTENRTGTGTGTGVRAATGESLCERGRGTIEGLRAENRTGTIEGVREAL